MTCQLFADYLMMRSRYRKWRTAWNAWRPKP